jgi:hypothetical protein
VTPLTRSERRVVRFELDDVRGADEGDLDRHAFGVLAQVRETIATILDLP